MFTKKEKRLVGEGCFTIIRESERYIEFFSNSTKHCWIICKNPDSTDKPVMIYHKHSRKGDNATSIEDDAAEQAETDVSGHNVQKTGQPETDASGHDVQRLGRAADMPKPYPVENARHNCTAKRGNPQGLKPVAGTSDKPANRVSLKEKMEAYRAQVADTGKPGIEKAKRREEAL